MHNHNFLESSTSKLIYRKYNGFTLIEVMIVVAIIGILASIAYPSYRNYIIKSKRNAAQSFMLDLANREKQYFLDARVYTSTLSDLGVNSLPNEVSPNYSITIGSIGTAPPSFTITASPIGSQAGDGDLTLDDTGAKTPAAKW